MKLRKFGTVKVFDLLFYSILLMMFFDIPYIQHVISPTIVLFVDLLLVALLALYVYFSRMSLQKPVAILVLYAAYFFVITFFGSERFGEFVLVMAPILSMAVLFSIINKKNWLHYVDKMVWYLIVITAIDFITMLLFPLGLYRSTSYTRNWFLGYETNRMLYSFPLLVLYYYSLSRKNIPLTISKWIVPVMVLVDMSMSGGDAGTAALAVYILLATISFWLKKHNERLHIGYTKLIYKYYIYFVLYAVMTFMFVIFQNSTLLVDIATTFFAKSATLSARIPIWNRCLDKISESLILGFGNLNYADYQIITGGYVNPHNIILTYMLTGGLAGLCFILCFMISCFRKLKWNPDNVYLLLGVYLIIFLGLTSSTLSYSPFLFTFCVLIYGGTASVRISDRSNKVVKNG